MVIDYHFDGSVMIAQGAFSATVIFSSFGALIGFDWSELE
jgi:hypothetical protein